MCITICFIQCPLPRCSKVYGCRLCHDDNEISHGLDRFAVREVVCRKCSTQQPVSVFRQSAQQHPASVWWCIWNSPWVVYVLQTEWWWFQMHRCIVHSPRKHGLNEYSFRRYNIHLTCTRTHTHTIFTMSCYRYPTSAVGVVWCLESTTALCVVSLTTMSGVNSIVSSVVCAGICWTDNNSHVLFAKLSPRA